VFCMDEGAVSGKPGVSDNLLHSCAGNGGISL
jgi:hypothetical protein